MVLSNHLQNRRRIDDHAHFFCDAQSCLRVRQKGHNGFCKRLGKVPFGLTLQGIIHRDIGLFTGRERVVIESIFV